ncbi:ABC transporter permease [Ponticoccus sp. SC2-23]|jgi:peptide/nickel transport system permease protein|nr:ABC transporter permease [Ponticoccus sp. SC6-9]MBM1225697.1 ABC transporter permease [Ponticoccus sp. SC6-15]MBM1227849.1 ABC transporter permease [Ponticoccus sp. SC6-38]MBM1234513.1 ABC transporter permease [Ponticoccus sp. SC6-45]MBM1238351.1 ABC transporter permease [Ponticoccus sp. SC6-49]MBM1243620.1 ABC transporter permease [Ponticoccus sp. SC2-64]MBM1248037.1 ABC transporter permease [Ponticoccus sp. SC6-42]MBM1252751.1 ABC transporter permease [Ponticoccus sp. SC6-33]MBM1256360
MLTYIARRLLTLIPMVIVISFLIYLGLELTPGDAVSHMVPPDALSMMDEERLQALRESLGLGKPFIVRYWIWITGVMQGEFGYSLAGGVPISKIFLDRLPATLELSFAALLISTVLGSILGTISALTRGSLTDQSLTVVGMLGVSIPEFFFGLVAILVFALNLNWFPVGGRILPGYDSFWDRLPHLVMPAMVLSIMMTAGVMRYARSSMLDALSRDFIRTARSKGMPEWRVNILHGFRVALTPVIVLIGFRLPVLIGGSVIIEQVFQWPGIGKEFVSAVRSQDYPLVMMVALFSVLAVLIASLIVDLLTAIIDPRVRLGE